MKWIFALLALLPCLLLADSSTRLPDGTEFPFWEKPLTFSKTYYVDGNSAAADDNGPGTKERPFRTIGKASQVLQPGERVVIAEGVYRELVSPPRGGSGPDKMISYEAAPGAKVFVKGSAVLKDGWQPSTSGGGPRGRAASPARIWQIDIDRYLTTVYNPFAMVNAPGSRYWLNFKVVNTAPYFRRRGMVFADGKPLEPVDQYGDLFGPSGRATSYYEDIPPKPLFDEMGGSAGKFWVDLKGNTIHVRLNGDDSPDKHMIEATVREQVLVPKERGLGYIRLKGITFQHSSDPIPLPQGGMVVTLGGNHWIIEDSTFEWGNALCLQVGGGGGGGGAPGAGQPSGSHVIRGNTIRYCGIGGIEGVGAGNVGLVEKNLIEWIGWQDAERSWEAGGVKFHGARNMLFRDNLIRHMRNAAAFWLDVGNINNRITRNVMADVVSVSGIIHMEATHEPNQIDNNVIWGVKNSETGGGLEGSGGTCIFIQGTDKLIIANNLIGNCQTVGVFAVPVEKRIIGTRGGTSRENKVYNNIFHSWGTAALGFMNQHNQSDGNLYVLPPRGSGYIRILAPEPQQWLDLAAWREFYGQEKSGALGAAEEISFDPDKVELTLLPRGDWPKVKFFNSVDTDLFGAATGDSRPAGPFADLEKGYKKRNVDTRLVRRP